MPLNTNLKLRDLIFSYRLRKLREKRNLRQSDLAQLLDLSQITISNWEKGRQEPSMEMLLKLSLIFDVELQYLFGADNKTTRKEKDILFGNVDKKYFEIYGTERPKTLPLIYFILQLGGYELDDNFKIVSKPIALTNISDKQFQENMIDYFIKLDEKQLQELLDIEPKKRDIESEDDFRRAWQL